MYNETFIIALEGADRLGKSSQSKLLQKKLNNSVYQKIPNRDGITFDRIYEMLHTGEALELPTFFQHLMATNRIIWQKQNLPLMSSMYKWIILDRWNLSTFVYGECTNISKRDCEIMTSGIVEPDLYLLFDGESFSMNKERDSYEKDKQLQHNVRQLYLKYAKEKNNVVVINANRPIETITEELYNECMKLENKHG